MLCNRFAELCFIAAFVSGITISNGQIACPLVTGIPTGVTVQNRNQQGAPLAANTVFIVQAGIVNCYGVIKEWKYWKKNDCDHVKFQVYRPAGANYRLIGENDYDATAPTHCGSFGNNMMITVPIAQNLQIPVEPGDIIGWEQVTYTANQGMIPFSNGGGVGIVLSLTGAVNVGGTFFFPNNYNMDPSLEAIVVAGPAPTLDNLPTTVSVYENQPANTYVYAVTASQQATARTNVWNQAVTITYSISPATTDFSINNAGLVQTTVGLDYETRQTYSVDVTVESMTYTVTKTLTVEVLDMDEAHTITNLPATKSVSALVRKNGDQIFQVTTTDIDTINPSTLYYSIRSWTTVPATPPVPPPPFLIDQDTGIVSCASDLDQFTFPGNPATVTYQLQLGASDGTFDATGWLTVPITDVHQPPAFINVGGGATTTIPENLPGGSHVYKVLASAYGLSPSTLTYSMDPSTPLGTRNTFTLDPTTGDIYLVANPGLDFVVQNSYTLSMTATDGILTSTIQNLVVAISWIDQAPQYDPVVYEVTIPEKCNNPAACCTPGPVGCILPLPVAGLAMTVQDRDVSAAVGTPTIDTLTCTIQTGYGSTLFISPMASCGVLEIGALIDVDAVPPSYTQINLTVKATDGYGKSDIAMVIVNVVDINDKVPFLLPATYSTSIPENTPGGLSLTTFAATDADLTSPNNVVRYSIQNLPDGLGTLYFEIDPVSGELSTKQAVDYETYTSISFNVLASDLGTPQQISTASPVTVTITDVNDNAPLWDCSDRPLTDPYILSQPCFYNLELRSDAYVGYKLQQLLSTDLDLYTAYYELLKPSYTFLLQKTSGWIQVKEVLEADTGYILYPIVSDEGPPQLYSLVLWVRIDTFTPSTHLVDIVLEVPGSSFNTTTMTDAFLAQLRHLINVVYGLTWWIQIDSVKLGTDRTTVTIYALEDTSTYDLNNLGMKKVFVSEDELLSKLRKNFFGTPNDDLSGPLFSAYKPIYVGPSYPNWWLDTVAGLCILTFLVLLALALIIAAVTLICKWRQVACFKPEYRRKFHSSRIERPVGQVNPNYDQKKQTDISLDDTSSVRQRLPLPDGSPDITRRRASIDTIHSIIYPQSNK